MERKRRIPVSATAPAVVAFLAAVPVVAADPVPPAAPPAVSPSEAARLFGFGATVALAGDELLVSRPGEIGLFPMAPGQAGAVHVFRRGEDGAWTETAAVGAEGVASGDGFGLALTVAGDLMVVGAPGREEGSGAAWVFRRGADGAWTEETLLQAPERAPGDRFGSAVAVAAGSVVVGAPGRDEGSGAAFAFRRDAATGAWGTGVRLEPAEGRPGVRFGAAVAVSDGRAFVGAPGPAALPGFLEAPPPQLPGAVHVFVSDDEGWRPEVRLAGPQGEAAGLGYALLPLEGELFVSAPTSRGFQGRVYRFARSDGSWSLTGALTPDGPAGFFGVALAAAGSDLLVGAPFAAQATGHVSVFRRGSPDGDWTVVQTLTIEGRGVMSGLGASLAAAGDLAVAGAPAADFFEGRAFLYARDDATGEWREATSVVEELAGLEPVVDGEVECTDGQARGFACSEVDLVAFLPVEAIGGGRGIMLNDLWGWTDPETGREYAIVGRFDGTSFVDVTDPANPLYLGNLPLREGARPNLSRDMKVYRDHAFIVADKAGPHGVQVFDLTRLRDVREPPVTFTEDANYDRLHSVHNIAINTETGFAYAVSSSGGGETCGGALHMIDIRDPLRPTFAGCYADPRTGGEGTGNTHDTQCVVYRGPDREHRGREICFNSSETALGIADVTDKEDPRPLAVATYPNVGYVHQGWLSEDHRHFFLNDELDEITGTVPRTRTLVWDVTDLDDPVLLAEHLGETEATDHNLYIRGRYMYQSNYVSGLRILDISDPANPVEVGWFDTIPYGEDVPGFAGSWSNYPFFESGIIVVTSMREGLFILRKREPRTVS